MVIVYKRRVGRVREALYVCGRRWYSNTNNLTTHHRHQPTTAFYHEFIHLKLVLIVALIRVRAATSSLNRLTR